MKQSRTQLLRQIYEYEQNNSSSLGISASSVNKFDLSALESEGYILQPIKGIGAYHLSLTEKGETFVTNGFIPETTAAPNSTFNFNNSTFENSVVGSGISGNQFTFHSSPSLTELEALIQSKPVDDQVTLNEMLEILRKIQNSEKPIEKGRLSRFPVGSRNVIFYRYLLTSFVVNVLQFCCHLTLTFPYFRYNFKYINTFSEFFPLLYCIFFTFSVLSIQEEKRKIKCRNKNLILCFQKGLDFI